MTSILFIGGGNMTRAIVNGLIDTHYSPYRITVCDYNTEKCLFFKTHYATNTVEKLSTITADILILAVKPQSAKKTCLELAELFPHKKPLIISVMAGITLAMLTEWLGGNLSIIRAMPNTPALINEAATGLFANDLTSEDQKQYADTLLSSIGITAWLENENQMDAITALSGSGPAYVFYLIEAMQIAAEKMGLSPQITKSFALQTAYGAAKLALNSDMSSSTLRAQVTSKGGTTEAALSVLQNKNFLSIVEKAMFAAFDKSKNMR